MSFWSRTKTLSFKCNGVKILLFLQKRQRRQIKLFILGHVVSYPSSTPHLAEMIKSCIAAAFKMKYVQVSSYSRWKKNTCSALKIQLFYIKKKKISLGVKTWAKKWSRETTLLIMCTVCCSERGCWGVFYCYSWMNTWGNSASVLCDPARWSWTLWEFSCVRSKKLGRPIRVQLLHTGSSFPSPSACSHM